MVLFFLDGAPTLHSEGRLVSWDLCDFLERFIFIALDMGRLSLEGETFDPCGVWCPGTEFLLLFPDSWSYEVERRQLIHRARV